MNGQSTKPDGKAIIQTCFKTDKRFDDVNKYTKGCGDQIVSVRKRKLHQARTQVGTKVGTKEGHSTCSQVEQRQGRRKGIGKV